MSEKLFRKDLKYRLKKDTSDNTYNLQYLERFTHTWMHIKSFKSLNEAKKYFYKNVEQ